MVQVLLRAAIVSYWQAAARVSNSSRYRSMLECRSFVNCSDEALRRFDDYVLDRNDKPIRIVTITGQTCVALIPKSLNGID